MKCPCSDMQGSGWLRDFQTSHVMLSFREFSNMGKSSKLVKKIIQKSRNWLINLKTSADMISTTGRNFIYFIGGSWNSNNSRDSPPKWARVKHKLLDLGGMGDSFRDKADKSCEKSYSLRHSSAYLRNSTTQRLIFFFKALWFDIANSVKSQQPFFERVDTPLPCPQ